MTSSIYARNGIVDSEIATPLTISNGGSGYQIGDVVVFEAPPNGTTATGVVDVVSDGVIATLTNLAGTLTGYTDGEDITLSGGTGAAATATAVITGGTIQSVSLVNGGAGYTVSDTLTITGVLSSTATATIDVGTINDDSISSINVTNVGLGYTSAPNIAVTSANGNGAIITAIVTLNFGMDMDVFANDVAFTSDDFRPGGGGILRIYFSFDSTTTAKVYNNGNFKGFLNADNSNTIAQDGYYRFDIDVEGGDGINLQLGAAITGVNFLRLHLVNFGA